MEESMYHVDEMVVVCLEPHTAKLMSYRGKVTTRQGTDLIHVYDPVTGHSYTIETQTVAKHSLYVALDEARAIGVTNIRMGDEWHSVDQWIERFIPSLEVVQRFQFSLDRLCLEELRSDGVVIEAYPVMGFNLSTTAAQIVGQLRVWHIPQVPGEAFHVGVADINEALKVLDILAIYDDFQYQQHVKPDYCNAQGVQVYDGTEWTDWYDEVSGEDLHDYRARLDDQRLDREADDVQSV
jgi:hypothetical protein